MILTIDFETRGSIDLKTSGVWKYAAHPETSVICLGVKVDSEKPRLWWSPWTGLSDLTGGELQALLDSADKIYAHNAEFERGMWETHMPYPLPIEKLHCTAAMAAYHALPRSLDGAAAALGLTIAKDREGYRLMLRMCKPQTDRKSKEKFWLEDRESLLRLGEYCKQDCEVEYRLGKALRDIPVSERKIWMVDQAVNRRGVQVDVQFVENAIRVAAEQQAIFAHEMTALTGSSPNQVAKLLAWTNLSGVPLTELTKASVTEALAGDLPADVQRVLEIRQSSARTSAAKYAAMQKRTSDDGRARSLFLYHAATTGRWGGRSIQPQNMPSRNNIPDPDLAIELIRNGASASDIDFLWGDTMGVLASCTRGALMAGPGRDLIAADYSSIEGRVLAWVVGEHHILEQYRVGADLYKFAAAAIYHKHWSAVNKFERQIGKVAELACGFAGGKHAFLAMAQGYGIEKLPEEEAAEIVRNWRENRPRTVLFWREVQEAAMQAIQNPGQVFVCHKTIWIYKEQFLACKLPSGRNLFYPFPRIGEKPAPWDETKMIPVIFFRGCDLNGHWVELDTFGGRLTENIVQAIARDILAEALVRLENSGKYRPVLHVHDEIVSEVAEGSGDVDEYCSIMVESPKWAAGLPLAAEGWVGKRYRK